MNREQRLLRSSNVRFFPSADGTYCLLQVFQGKGRRVLLLSVLIEIPHGLVHASALTGCVPDRGLRRTCQRISGPARSWG